MDDCLAWWEITLLYFFSWNCTWFEQNESMKVQNFRLSTAHVKFHQIFTLIGSLRYKILAKKYKGVISHEPEDWCKIWKKKLICCFKKDKNMVKFDPSTQKSTKVFNIWLRKVQMSYLSLNWRVMQNVKKNWLAAWNMTWGIWQIFTRALESLKIGILMGSFKPK